MLAPLYVISPRRGGVRPVIERSVVVLPAPFRPEQGHHLALADREREPVQDVAEPVVGVDAADVEDHGAATPPR